MHRLLVWREMDEGLQRPSGSKSHRKQMVLGPQRNLPEVRIVAGDAMGQRQRSITVDAGLKTGQTLQRQAVHGACNAAPITTGIRSQAHKVQPVPEDQSKQ